MEQPNEALAMTEEEAREEQKRKNAPVIALLDSWLEEDLEESSEDQMRDLEALMRGIDAEREPDRRLFDKYLK